jgi:ribosomal peptide maturation radical SAM protein 1
LEQVILACAPFFSIVRPSFGISLLKSALLRRGISCSIRYLNLEFADEVGPGFHESAATGVANTLLVGEWIFSPMVNRDAKPALEERYREELARLYSPLHLEQIESIQTAARLFVETQAQRLAAASPQILGFTTSFQQNCASLAIAQRARELNPRIIICFGGANCEGPMGQALLDSFPQIDYVFSGESDHTFPEFAAQILTGKPYTPSGGILARKTAAAILPLLMLNNPSATGRVEELDALPHPDFTDYFDTLDRTGYRSRIEPALVFESSRGCWWGAKQHCRFCGLNGNQMAYRAKSAPRVLDEIDALSRRYSVRRFLAADNIMSMKHLEKVFGAMTPGADGPRFFYELKSNLSRTHLEILARGGVNWIQPGIESLDDELLREMQKGVTALQNISVLRNCVELGMRATWTILYGFPGETAGQYRRIQEFVPLLEHLEPPNGCVPIRLDRFSPYYERSSDYGFHSVKPVWAYSAVYALSEEQIAKLAYYFEDRDRPGIDYVGELSALVEGWNRSWRSGANPPVLEAKQFGPGLCIEDTRNCSSQRWRWIQGIDVAALRALREPRNIKVVLSELGVGADESLARLVEWGYALVDKDRALSLVAEPDVTALSRPRNSDFPGGFLLPPPLPLQKAPVEQAVGV